MPLEGARTVRRRPVLRRQALAVMPAHRVGRASRDRQRLALAGRAALELDLAGRRAARPDDDLPGQADQVHGGELGAGALVAVVVEHVDAGRS